MDRLKIAPDKDGYGWNEPEGIVFTDTAGGFPKTRLDTPNAPYLIDLQWTVNENGANFLLAFHRRNKLRSFVIPLIVESVEPSDYTARFVPKSFRYDGCTGLTHFFSAQVYALPVPVASCPDELILQLNECFDCKPGDMFCELESLLRMLPNG